MYFFITLDKYQHSLLITNTFRTAFYKFQEYSDIKTYHITTVSEITDLVFGSTYFPWISTLTVMMTL